MRNFLLKIVAVFNPFWRQLGADTNQLRAILNVKLMMDSRRQQAFSRGVNTGSGETKNQDVISVVAHLFFGMFLGVLLIFVPDKTAAMVLYFAAFMVFMAMTIISDFTDVLIDVRDNYILLPRPVSDRTVTLSRILHIFLYLSKNVVAFIIPAVVILAFTQPLGIPVFLLQVLIALLLVVLIVNGIYLLLLRITTPQRFKDVISYFQIGFTILIFAAYYLLPKLFDFTALNSAAIFSNPVSYLVPPVWVAAIWEIIVNQHVTIVTVSLASLSLVTTVFGSYLVATVLAKNLSRKMMAISQGKPASGPGKTTGKSTSEHSLGGRLAAVFTNSIVENAAFRFTWLQISRNRDYKLKTYPALGFIPIFFVYMTINGNGSLAERLESLQEGEKYLVLIYIAAFMAITPLTNALYADKFKAAWVVFSAPLEQPGSFIAGAFKAIVVQFMLPVYLVMWVVGTAIWGWKVTDDFVLGLATISMFALLSARLFFNKIPFSKPWSDLSKGGNFAKGMLAMLVIGVFGAVHYFLVDKTTLILAVSLVVAILCLPLYRSLKRLTWPQLQR